METLRKLRFILYPTIFIIFFLGAAYGCFPKEVVKKASENYITIASFKGGPKNRGVPAVSIGDASLWRLSGIQVKDLKITWPPVPDTAPLMVDVQRLYGRVGIFSLLTGSRSISSKALLYDGKVAANLKLKKDNQLSRIKLDASGLEFNKMAFLPGMFGIPMAGAVDLKLDIDAKSDLRKEGSGTVQLSFKNWEVGPGNVSLPAGGFMPSVSLPKVVLGLLSTSFELDKGQLSSKTFSLSGGDIEAEGQLSIILGPIPPLSRLNGSGWFKVKPEFRTSNETIKILFELLPELKAAQMGDGKVGFSLRGSVARPQFRLERYVGEKKVDKEKKVAGK